MENTPRPSGTRQVRTGAARGPQGFASDRPAPLQNFARTRRIPSLLPSSERLDNVTCLYRRVCTRLQYKEIECCPGGEVPLDGQRCACEDKRRQ